MLDRLLGVVAPHICCACETENALVCESCLNDIIETGFEQCMVCLKPAASNLCLTCRAAAPYDEAWVVSERSGGVRELIDRYKFDRATAGADMLARLLDARLPVVPAQTIVTYIPDIALHRRQRGYDHMARVARAFAARRSLSCWPLLTRLTSLSQRGADKKERITRQAGAFRAEPSIDRPVVLIDDICTTGATITAGAAALRAVSAHPVFVAVVARQPLK